MPITTGSPWPAVASGTMTHFEIAAPAPLAGIARNRPPARRVEVELRATSTTRPASSTKPWRTRSIAFSGGTAANTVRVEDGYPSYGAPTIRCRHDRNGKQGPTRPTSRSSPGSACPEAAAAIAAAIEQFLRDTAPPPAAADHGASPWLRAALFEGVDQARRPLALGRRRALGRLALVVPAAVLLEDAHQGLRVGRLLVIGLAMLVRLGAVRLRTVRVLVAGLRVVGVARSA